MGGVPPWGGGRVGHGPLRTILSAPQDRHLRRSDSDSQHQQTPHIGSAPQDRVPHGPPESAPSTRVAHVQEPARVL